MTTVPTWINKFVEVCKLALGVEDSPTEIEMVDEIVTPEGLAAWAVIDTDTGKLLVDKELPESDEGYYVLTHEVIHIPQHHLLTAFHKVVSMVPLDDRAEALRILEDANEDFVHGMTIPIRDLVRRFCTEEAW